MSESAMTTEDVVEIYYDAPGMQSIAMAGTFERWLAHHDAQVTAQALREFRAGLGRRFWFQDPYGHFDPNTVSALHRQVEGMLDAEANRIEQGGDDE